MLHPSEARMLRALSGRMPAEELAAKSSLPLQSVLSFSQSLKEKGYATIETAEEQSLALTEEGARYAKEGLPEERVLSAALEGRGIGSLSAEEKSIGLQWAIKNGWVKIEGGSLAALCGRQDAYPLKKALQRALAMEAIPNEDALLLARRRLATQSSAKKVFISPTAAMPPQMAGFGEGEESQLTRQMLLDGSFRGRIFRKYYVSAQPEIPPAAKRHMVRRLGQRIRRIFCDMGFEEMQGGEPQSSFWNFDALFQPQDHPARDLADTFYLKKPSPLPDDSSLVSRVKKIHERFWGGEWLEENAAKSVLRTHTTSLSARCLYENCQGKLPKKHFALGKVYRNEATDYKHLAEFFQVEGIVVWENATFRDLLGCLREFYRKLGFDKIRFQPSYFPYTEPSLEVSVYFEKKKQWLEFGGAGIFRPEVSIPLCDRYPVLAWGLSLERPLMLQNEMDDIRDFYKSNAGWLRRQKIQ